MKKTLVLIPLVLFFAFAFLFGLAFGGLIRQASADESMPYSLIRKNDAFSLTLKTNQHGQISAITYGYEFAN